MKKQKTPGKKALLDFVYKHYCLDAAKAHGFKARLSLADLRKLKAYAMNHLPIGDGLQ